MAEEEEPGIIEKLKTHKDCKDFATALIESSRSNTSATTTFGGGSYVFTGLAEQAHTPFSNATGTSSRKMVVISKVVGKEQDVVNDAEILSESAFEEETKQPFATSQLFSVAITNSVKQKAMYITQDQPFLSNASTSLFLTDLGARPMPLDEARYLCSLYTLCCRDSKLLGYLPDIWVLCQDKIVCIGCCVNQTLKRIDTYKIVSGGVVTVPSSNSYSVSLDSNPFNGGTNGPEKFTSCKKNQKVVTARYEFGPTSSMEEDSLLMTSMLSTGVCISLDFIWNGRDACFSSPPDIAETVINVSVTPGYQMSPVLGVFMEVSTLLKLCKIVSGKDTWETGCESDDEEVLERTMRADLLSPKVKAFLEDSSSQFVKTMETSLLSPTAELSPFHPREDLDFLDQLWVFLRHFPNLEDLIESLGAIFKAVILGRVQPFVHRSKTSTLAVLFRRCLSSRSTDERQVVATKLQCLLTEEKALRCLVEIGIEKLQGDFMAFFSLGGLATAGDLDSFVDSAGLMEQCYGLCKLQYVLELATVLSTFVSLPLHALSLFVRDALKCYKDMRFEEFTTSPTFKINFPPMSAGSKTLISLASALKPISWSVTILEDSSDSVLRRRRMFCLEKPLFNYLSSSASHTEDSVLYLYNVRHQSVNCM